MDPTAESKNPYLDPQDPKNFCYTCNKKLKVVLINRRQQCKKCKKENPQPRPEPKPRSRFPWEDYGFETIWDINQETGIAEERVVFEDGKFPNTAEFWHDLWIAQQAFESKDVSLFHFHFNPIHGQSNQVESFPNRGLKTRTYIEWFVCFLTRLIMVFLYE